jgi:hypothetical protein
MWRKLTAVVLSLAVPALASAGPLREAVEKAARESSFAQDRAPEGRSRSRFWTGMTLIAAGAVLTTLGSVEIGDDEDGPDDAEDFDDSDDGEDSDANAGLLGGGIAAAGIGTWLLLTGRRSAPTVSAGPGRFVVRQTVRF